jgi:hypothetical protein
VVIKYLSNGKFKTGRGDVFQRHDSNAKNKFPKKPTSPQRAILSLYFKRRGGIERGLVLMNVPTN